ncbi:MAG: DUF1611 domain-containing protein [Planctomycetes bacterium]|nr:DUF1611 domain-containing protein [Planctomycetota bacterium]
MNMRRMIILTEGHLGVFDSKTATSVIRYRSEEVVAVLDSTCAGKKLEEFIGVGKGIPIVGSVNEALKFKPTVLLIGIAPPGGALPLEWRRYILDAISHGLDIISGLHTYLGEDPEFARLASEKKVTISDVRKPPEDLPIGTGKAKDVFATKILTVGTDCNIGKMVTSIEITCLAKEQGINACFVATGQTGIMIEGSGIAVDRVIADFIAGAAEQLVLERAHYDLLLIEGQGSLNHPAYSGVTLGLLHGSVPDGLILCHQPGRNAIRRYNFPIPPLLEMINMYENISKPVHPCKVLGISLNCYGISNREARKAVDETEEETNLPTTDPIMFGSAKLLEPISSLVARRSGHGLRATGHERRVT